jgi:hypothetical protein
MSQSNTQAGQIVLNSSENLQDKEGYLVKIINTSNVAKFALPDAETDLALFVITDGGGKDENTAALPLSPDRNVRLKLSGTCVPGDVLVLADIDGTHDGKVKTLPVTVPGTYRGIAIAEEVGADEQLVKARPAMIGNITITG